MEKVGYNVGLFKVGREDKDFFFMGDCDDVFIAIAQKAGWLPELIAYADQMSEISKKKLNDAAIRAGIDFQELASQFEVARQKNILLDQKYD